MPEQFTNSSDKAANEMQSSVTVFYTVLYFALKHCLLLLKNPLSR